MYIQILKMILLGEEQSRILNMDDETDMKNSQKKKIYIYIFYFCKTYGCGYLNIYLLLAGIIHL